MKNLKHILQFCEKAKKLFFSFTNIVAVVLLGSSFCCLHPTNKIVFISGGKKALEVAKKAETTSLKAKGSADSALIISDEVKASLNDLLKRYRQLQIREFKTDNERAELQKLLEQVNKLAPEAESILGLLKKNNIDANKFRDDSEKAMQASKNHEEESEKSKNQIKQYEQEIKDALADVEANKLKAKTSTEEAEKHEKKAKKLSDEAEKHQQEAEKQKKLAEDYAIEANKSKTSSEEFKNKAQEAQEKADNFAKQAEQLKTNAEAHNKKAEEAKENAQKSLKKVEESKKEADTLQNVVKGYKTAAETAKNAAETAKNAADNAKNEADKTKVQIDELLKTAKSEFAAEKLKMQNELNTQKQQLETLKAQANKDAENAKSANVAAYKQLSEIKGQHAELKQKDITSKVEGVLKNSDGQLNNDNKEDAKKNIEKALQAFTLAINNVKEGDEIQDYHFYGLNKTIIDISNYEERKKIYSGTKTGKTAQAEFSKALIEDMINNQETYFYNLTTEDRKKVIEKLIEKCEKNGKKWTYNENDKKIDVSQN